MAEDLDRDDLGRIVRALWVDWAHEQPDPKPSWLAGWDDLDEGQREVDRRIGAGIAAVVREQSTTTERERIATMADRLAATVPTSDGPLDFSTVIRHVPQDGDDPFED